MLIITHAGPRAHADEILSIAVVMAFADLPDGESFEIERRDPTDEELADPNVYVLDVGMRHEPLLSNFDHHQRPRSAVAECAFSLVSKHFGVFEILCATNPGFRRVAAVDSNPFGYMTSIGADTSKTMEVLSPTVGAFVGDLFVSDSPEEFALAMQLLQYISTKMLCTVENWNVLRQRGQDNSWVSSFAGVNALVLEKDLGPLTGAILASIKADYEAAYKVAFCEDGVEVVHMAISPSTRPGETHVIYRYDDDPKVDCRQIAGKIGVVFTHPNGFLAKLNVSDPLEMARGCVVEI